MSEIMPARYAFWRTPEGRPYRGTDGKHAPSLILAEIGKCVKADANGSVAFENLSHECENALASSLLIAHDNEEVSDFDVEGITWQALKIAAKKSGSRTAISPATFLTAVNTCAAEYFRKQPESFDIATSLSVSKLPRKRITVRDCEVTAIPKSGPKLELSENLSMLVDHALEDCGGAPVSYLKIKIRTDGRTPSAAVNKGFDALNLLRGIWTLFGTYRAKTISLGVRREKPIGVISVGPVHTLHHLNGMSACDFYWYESNYPGAQQLFSPGKRWDYIDSRTQWAFRKLRLAPHGKEVEELICRFVVALDHVNLDVSFLQMWSLLEKITDTVGKNYDETIRRAVWIFKDRDFASEMLESLRQRRNQYVHAARSGHKGDQIVYSMKSFVELHLLRLIRNDFQVSSLREYGEFLSLPFDVGKLKRDRNIRTKAIRFLTPPTTSAPPIEGRPQAS